MNDDTAARPSMEDMIEEEVDNEGQLEFDLPQEETAGKWGDMNRFFNSAQKRGYFMDERPYV